MRRSAILLLLLAASASAENKQLGFQKIIAGNSIVISPITGIGQVTVNNNTLLFLGSATANAAATMALSVSSQVSHIECDLFVAGYNAGAIASVQLGVSNLFTAIDSGTNYAASYSSGGFANNTSVSVTGIRTGPDPITGPRSVHFTIEGSSTTTTKRLKGHNNSSSTSAATAPTNAVWSGIWVGTAGLVTRIQINNFTALTGTTQSTMNNGTVISCWGWNDS